MHPLPRRRPSTNWPQVPGSSGSLTMVPPPAGTGLLPVAQAVSSPPLDVMSDTTATGTGSAFAEIVTRTGPPSTEQNGIRAVSSPSGKTNPDDPLADDDPPPTGEQAAARAT